MRAERRVRDAGAVGCPVVAAISVVVWPQEGAVGLASAHRFVLRWTHPAVWVALAAACLLWGSGAREPAGVPRRVRSVGLARCVVSVVALVLA